MWFPQFLKDLIRFPAPPVSIDVATKPELAHPVWETLNVEYAPVPGGRHTTYMLVLGESPGTVSPFPAENFMLTTPEHKTYVRELIMEKGFALSV